MFGRRRRVKDLSAEIEAHLDEEADALRANGLDEDAARAAARRAFGNRAQVEEQFYESGRWLPWDHLVRDVRHAVRSLAKIPGLLAVLVACLGSGIGINAAIFGVFDSVVLRKPTVREPDRLVSIDPGNSNRVSYLNYRDLRGAGGFQDLAITASAVMNLRTGDAPEAVTGLQVSGNYFDLLGVRAWRGRTFTGGESRPEDHPHVVMLDHAFWTRQFSAADDIVGRTIPLNGQPFTVVGVLDADYRPAGLGFMRPDF